MDKCCGCCLTQLPFTGLRAQCCFAHQPWAPQIHKGLTGHFGKSSTLLQGEKLFSEKLGEKKKKKYKSKQHILKNDSVFTQCLS